MFFMILEKVKGFPFKELNWSYWKWSKDCSYFFL